MEYSIKDDDILTDTPYFDALQILSSGQVFRWQWEDDGYTLFSGDEMCRIFSRGHNKFVIKSANPEYFVKYFHLDTDYAEIFQRITDFGGAAALAANFGKGIRILRQQPEETIFSFIISANNNIKRIQGIISRICAALGKQHEHGGITYRAFPSAAALAEAGTEFFYSIGCGYRAPYIADSAKMIVSGEFDILKVQDADAAAAQKYLMRLSGVGPKVADCILLFGYGRQDVFPTDTWIEKVYRDYFSDGTPIKDRKAVAKSLVLRFGSLSGLVQQYLFFYKRELEGRASFPPRISFRPFKNTYCNFYGNKLLQFMLKSVSILI